MRNLLDTSKCVKFSPSFDNKECDHYQFAGDGFDEIDHGACGFCNRPGAYRCIADVTRIIPLSHSSISDFCTCHYLYYLKKILGITTRPPFLPTPVKAGQLWDTIKQKHLGADKNIKATIDEYEIDPITVAKVRAIYHAYKELEIIQLPGFELQAPINLSFDISLPTTSFIPSIKIGSESINLWLEHEKASEDKRTWTFPIFVTGFYDLKYPTFFCEDKLSGRPEFYLDPEYIQSQNGTYFLADPNLEYCIEQVVLFPQQKEMKKKEESPDEMYKRVYDDVLSRPSKYFIGWDREKRQFGRKFFRGEFDLEGLKRKYEQVVIEILAARWTGNWYKNWKSCNNVLPGVQCDYRVLCKNGNVSETIYKIREKG